MSNVNTITPTAGTVISIAEATAEDFLSGGDNNITRHESTTTHKNGAPLVFYMRKPRAAIGIKAATQETDASAAMLQAIAESLCDRNGNLLFINRVDQIADMPLDLFQEVSGLINGKLSKPVEAVEGEA